MNKIIEFSTSKNKGIFFLCKSEEHGRNLLEKNGYKIKENFRDLTDWFKGKNFDYDSVNNLLNNNEYGILAYIIFP
jgi:hypothetical protein